MRTSLFIILFSSYLFSKDIRIDTLITNVSLHNFDVIKLSWLSKFGYNQQKQEGYAQNSYCWYGIVPMREGFYLRTTEVSSESTLIELMYPRYASRKAQINYRAPNISYTLQQEIEGVNNTESNVRQKSYFAFLGITMLNPGMGLFYAYNKNPVIKPNWAILSVYTLVDLVSIVGLFSKDKNIKNICGAEITIQRGLTLLSFTFVKWNNELSRTKYNFIFK